MNNVIEQYQQEGYYLAKKIFKPKQAQEAADWLRSQNLILMSNKAFRNQKRDTRTAARLQTRIHNSRTKLKRKFTD